MSPPAKHLLAHQKAVVDKIRSCSRQRHDVRFGVLRFGSCVICIVTSVKTQRK
ncbi:hypothetical protein BIW11_09057 [Tropilaelaps mercedesae]|uniref:Uncharacterized protein n=1 Tax=Tropilaelaps mercedesae TaxID=418985 RepID=A0A1V9XLU0_9ACAR|nr:hypothetical protein BIW11_09057 [Tropilaelaps mercedesae]